MKLCFNTMDHMTSLLLPFLIALVSVLVLHPQIVTIAKLKNIVDNPNARKLQKVPVPILGGVVVYFGIVIGTGCSIAQMGADGSLLMALTAMTLMLYTGTTDDLLDLRPLPRFLMQILTVCLLIFCGGFALDDLHGLFGCGQLTQFVAVPLTIFACVGIINALNLIDGVDGLSSGYCIMSSIVFGTVFVLGQTDPAMCVLAAGTIGSLIPFFLHNVFGLRSKMFIGDGGTLLMGVLMSVFVMRSIQSDGVNVFFAKHNLSSVAFTLAVLSIPVFDTLRVMLGRIYRKHSPFHPDKTHLHHLFIELGCSHIVTTIIILSLNFIILLAWALSGYLGASYEGQLAVVIGLGLLFTWGIYGGFKTLQHRSPDTFARIAADNRLRNPKRDGFFLTLQRWIDKI